MVLQPGELSAQSQRALKLAACLGPHFELALLARVCEVSPDVLRAWLGRPLQAGLLLAVPGTAGAAQTYQFADTAVQQAAYALPLDISLAEAHLRIGRALWQQTTGTQQAAVHYFQHGLDLLPSGTGSDPACQGLRRELHAHLSECETVCGLQAQLDANIRREHPQGGPAPGLAGTQQDSRDLQQTGGCPDTLDFAHAPAGRPEAEVIPFALDTVLQTLAGLCAEKTYSRGLALQWQIAPEVPHMLLGDALHLGQILMHYTRAALRCTRHGTVHIGVSLAAQDATSVKLRFAAHHSTNAASGDGNAKAAARQRNMERTMGRATDRARADNFWFNALLERVAASATEAPEGRCAPHAPARSSLLDAVRGARILLVDAHAEHQQAAQELLESAGFAVALADNGQQALFRIDQSTRGRCPFDLVLMDLQMPVLDGISAVRLLRSMPQFGLLPIVAMGANAGQAQRLLCLRAGMNDLLGKPLLPQALGQALQRWIRPRRGLGLEADPEAGRNAGRTVGREIGRTGVRNAGRDGSPDGVRDAGQGSATRTPETRWQAWPPAPYLPSPPPWPSTPPGPV